MLFGYNLEKLYKAQLQLNPELRNVMHYNFAQDKSHKKHRNLNKLIAPVDADLELTTIKQLEET